MVCPALALAQVSLEGTRGYVLSSPIYVFGSLILAADFFSKQLTELGIVPVPAFLEAIVIIFGLFGFAFIAWGNMDRLHRNAMFGEPTSEAEGVRYYENRYLLPKLHDIMERSTTIEFLGWTLTHVAVFDYNLVERMVRKNKAVTMYFMNPKSEFANRPRHDRSKELISEEVEEGPLFLIYR